MAIRSQMLALIQQVRDLIGDPDTGASQFSAQQVQDALDESRLDIRYELLAAAPTITNDGTTGSAEYVWIDYFSIFKYWEVDSAVVQYGDFTEKTPVATEYIAGHWQFSVNVPPGTLPANSSAPGQYPPLFVTGRAYDIYAAACKLLRMWIAALAGSTYNFSANGQSFQRFQIIQSKQFLLQEYGRMQLWRDAEMVRDDHAGPHHASVPVHLYGLNDRLP